MSDASGGSSAVQWVAPSHAELCPTTALGRAGSGGVPPWTTPPCYAALRALHEDDLDDLFRWEGDPAAADMAALTRSDPTDRAAFDAHYRRVRSDPDTTNQAIEQDGAFVGMIASFTIEGDRELTYWVDPGDGDGASRLERYGSSSSMRLSGRSTRELRRTDRGSATVLERNGFVKIGEETSWADGAGEEVLEHIYRPD